MYGMFFFMSQFLQDVQGYSPLRGGFAFLPMPASLFLASQLTSKVLSRRLPDKVLMLAGSALASLSLLVATHTSANSSYAEIVVAIVLLGLGGGISFVSLTTASLTDVEPRDAGAASGLINVSQQLGAALGLAVLVTAFGVATKHEQFGGRMAPQALAHVHGVMVHGIDDAFAIAITFTAAALVLIAGLVRTARPAGSAPVLAAAADRADGAGARTWDRTDEWVDGGDGDGGSLAEAG
jgi:MFS family permease